MQETTFSTVMKMVHKSLMKKEKIQTKILVLQIDHTHMYFEILQKQDTNFTSDLTKTKPQNSTITTKTIN